MLETLSTSSFDLFFNVYINQAFNSTHTHTQAHIQQIDQWTLAYVTNKWFGRVHPFLWGEQIKRSRAILPLCISALIVSNKSVYQCVCACVCDPISFISKQDKNSKAHSNGHRRCRKVDWRPKSELSDFQRWIIGAALLLLLLLLICLAPNIGLIYSHLEHTMAKETATHSPQSTNVNCVRMVLFLNDIWVNGRHNGFVRIDWVLPHSVDVWNFCAHPPSLRELSSVVCSRRYIQHSLTLYVNRSMDMLYICVCVYNMDSTVALPNIGSCAKSRNSKPMRLWPGLSIDTQPIDLFLLFRHPGYARASLCPKCWNGHTMCRTVSFIKLSLAWKENMFQAAIYQFGICIMWTLAKLGESH